MKQICSSICWIKLTWPPLNHQFYRFRNAMMASHFLECLNEKCFPLFTHTNTTINDQPMMMPQKWIERNMNIESFVIFKICIMEWNVSINCHSNMLYELLQHWVQHWIHTSAMSENANFLIMTFGERKTCLTHSVHCYYFVVVSK